MQKLTVQGEEFLVEVQGAGPPLLFVHGFPFDHSMWRAQLAEFARTHLVIAPDLRGFGQSTVTPGTVSMAQFADDLAGLLDSLHVAEPVTFCGLSMGGYIAWAFVERHLARLHSLILCDTRAVADTADAAAGRLKTADEVLSRGPEVLARAMLPKLVAAGTSQRAPELVEELRQTMLRAAPEGIAAALRGMAARPDRQALLPTIRVPTLVIVGEDDIISPAAEMRSLAEAIPGARFAEIPQAGHMAPLENPAAVNDALRSFLAGAAHR